jgi:hypothetical protein
MGHHGIAHDGVFEALLLVGMACDANFTADVVRRTRASAVDLLVRWLGGTLGPSQGDKG